MLQKLFSIIISLVISISAGAQGTCIINGNIADIKLADGSKIKAVSLMRADENGQKTEVAVAKVKKGEYTFKYELSKNEPVLMYTIAGFGEDNDIELFIEAGEITVSTPSAAKPCMSTVRGTPTNDTYTEYKAILNNRENEIATMVKELVNTAGHNEEAIKKLQARESIKTRSQIIRFLIDHNTSPMTPFEIERTLLPILSTAYADQIVKSVSTTLHSHPYYHSLRNKVLANDMKVGNELPDITLPMLDGEKKNLNDFRGKYVILNFWSSDCAKSASMITELQHLYEVIKGKEEYVIISFSLDNDTAAWKEAVNSKGIKHEVWLHASDGAGMDSPAAKTYKVEKTPQIILVEPEGRAVSLNMDIDEVVMRIEQIMSGDLYYLDQKEE